MYSIPTGLGIGLLLVGLCSAAPAPDPTKVCYPTTFTARYFDMITEDHGTIAFDFTLHMFAQMSEKTGTKILHDFENLKSYAISGQEDNRTECRSSTLHQSEVMLKCLPPYSKLVPGTTGLMGSNVLTTNRLAIDVQTWDVETEYDTIHRVAFRVYGTNPPWPVLSQEYGYKGTTHVYVYLDGSLTIKDRETIFAIPPQCITEKAVSLPLAG